MEVITTHLNNGLTIATQKNSTIESVSSGLWIKAGSRNEALHENGLAHMLEHMTFKGTKTRSAKDIAIAIENVGGEINASTSVEITGYFSRVLQKDTNLAIDILADIMTNSVFDAEELEKERHVVLQELGANNDSPSDVVFDHFMNVVFQNQSIGRPILGTKESLATFKPENFKDFMIKHYYKKNMVFVGVGAIEHDKFVKQAEKCFAQIPKQQITPVLENSKYIGGRFTEIRDLMDAQIILGFPGCTYLDKNFYAAHILALILGGGMSSRLFQNIREELGLCYSIYSFHWGFSDNGIFGISASTDSQGLKQLIPAIIKELKMLSEHINEYELQRAISQYKASIIMSYENAAGRASTIARQILLNNKVLSKENIFDRLNQVTIQELKNLAQNIFFNSTPSLAGVGPVKNLLSTEELSYLLAK